MTPTRRLIIAIAASAGAAAGITCGAQGAIASANIAAPSPAVIEDGHQFYSDAQINSAWTAATANFGHALPAGRPFSRTPPSFFKPGDGQKHLFETGLPVMIAATYYRCAWLEEASHDAADERTADVAKADLYFSIPEVQANFINLRDYLPQLKAGAKAASMDPVDYELKTNCEGLTGD